MKTPRDPLDETLAAVAGAVALPGLIVGLQASFLDAAILGVIGALVFIFWLLVIGATVPVSRIAESAAGRGFGALGPG